MRPSAITRSLCALALLVAAPLHGQDTGPTAGTWGVETGNSGGIALLKFRSATAAWMFGLSGAYQRRDDEGNQDLTFATVELRAGIRAYQRPTERIRPFRGISAIVGYQEQTPGNGALRYGGAGEIGASYFFSRHVSLGGGVDLSATYMRNERTDFLTGQEIGVTTIVVQTGLRMLGAVYF